MCVGEHYPHSLPVTFVPNSCFKSRPFSRRPQYLFFCSLTAVFDISFRIRYGNYIYWAETPWCQIGQNLPSNDSIAALFLSGTDELKAKHFIVIADTQWTGYFKRERGAFIKIGGVAVGRTKRTAKLCRPSSSSGMNKPAWHEPAQPALD